MYSVLRVLGQVVRWVRIAIAMQRLRKFSKEEQGIAKNALGNLLGEARFGNISGSSGASDGRQAAQVGHQKRLLTGLLGRKHTQRSQFKG